MICTVVHAFGNEGHQVVARLAVSQLTPQTKAKIDRLLALEPGSSLASISTWADDTKNRHTAPWHYVNFPREADCHYVKERDCPEGRCLVEAVNTQLKVLNSASAPDQAKLIALKYVIHLVADLHQPLHAGFADDRGGNMYQVQFMGRGTNLHAVWDTGLLRGEGLEVEALVSLLGALPTPSEATELDPDRIAEESCRIASSEGFYPARKMSPEYVEWARATLRARLVLAGARLSGILNAARR
ncbi:S1/P1 nuclease [Caenimonas sp. SL110]|uniref:S1/P1 nuclease n=1 Tax=Caenimonas sp. SL110 TaxID=1450524 RepID=UPI0019311351|nr:S1/P1 nuclease [Caenimonas sp. SL110]